MTVYHGTNTEFLEFDAGCGGSRSGDGAGNLGFFFSESRQIAAYFTDDQNEIIIEANLVIKRPFEMTADQFEYEYADLTPEEALHCRTTLEATGFDGIRIEKGGAMLDHDAVVWIAFYPEQIQIIKPAAANRLSSRHRPS